MLTNIRTVFKPYGCVLLHIDSLIKQILNNQTKESREIEICESHINILNIILKGFKEAKIPYNLLILNPSLLSILKNSDFMKNLHIYTNINQEIINNHSITISNDKHAIGYITLLGSYAGLFSGMFINMNEINIHTINPSPLNIGLLKSLEIKLNAPEDIQYLQILSKNDKNLFKIVKNTNEFNLKYPIPVTSEIFFNPTKYRYFDLQLLLSNFKEEKSENQYTARSLQERSDQTQMFFKRSITDTSHINNVKLKAAQKKIIIENMKSQQSKLKQTRIQFLKSFYAKYKNLQEDEKIQFLKTPTDDIFIKIYIKLLKVEVEVEKWNRESLKAEPDDSKILLVYVDGLEMYELIKNYVLEIHELYVTDVFNHNDIEERINDIKKKVFFIQESFERCSLNGIKEEILKKFESLIAELFPRIYKNLKPGNIEINELDVYFQIKHCGPYLSRSLRPALESSLVNITDSRVVFSPDEWQVKLLDLVDTYGKALVCAPTASGKTFISYYAIERVLTDYYKIKYTNKKDRKGDEERTGNILFVAPTKSLANQISSDIYTRFSNFSIQTNKNRQESIKNLQGTLAQDFFIDINNHVLIVTPEMLETLNLDNYDFIIIDEFHLINNNSCLERAICRIKGGCLLLSATISNENEVLAYLNNLDNSNKLSKGTYKLITSNKRFAELYYFIYEDEKKDAYEIHPYVSLINTERCKLEFMNLTPPNVMSLYYSIYNAIKTFHLKEYKKLFKEISIKNFFKSNILIRKDVEDWEVELVAFANKLITEVEKHKKEIFNEIIKYCCLESENLLSDFFNYKGKGNVKETEERFIDLSLNLKNNPVNNNNIDTFISNSNIQDNNSNNKCCDNSFNYKNIVNLLLNMKERSLADLLPPLVAEKISPKRFPLKNSLPALVFILDNDSCMSACIYTYYYLLSYNDLINQLIKIFEDYSLSTSATTKENDKEKKIEDLKKKISKQEKRIRDVKKEKDYWKEETLLKDERAELERDRINEYTSFTSELTRCSENELKSETRWFKSVFRDDLTKINQNLEILYKSSEQNQNFENIKFVENEEINIQINKLIRQINNINPSIHLDLKTINLVLLDMLKYGLAIHAENLSKRYRFLVEKLFRNKAILITFSTLTLSLGINMPCKTVIFGEDSINLCSSGVKQISGRAGRRGYDVKGNIVFVEKNFSKKRIIDLISNTKCEEIRSEGINDNMKIRLLDVTSCYNETIDNLVYETVKCKPNKRDEKGLNNLLENNLYGRVNHTTTTNEFSVFSDNFSHTATKKKGIFAVEDDESNSSSDSVFDIKEKYIEIPQLEYNTSLYRNIISDLLISNANINMQVLVLLITRGLINLETVSFERVVFLIGLLLNTDNIYSSESNEYILIQKEKDIKEILGDTVFEFLKDINSMNIYSLEINTIDANLIKEAGFNIVDGKLPFINFSFKNEIYDIFVLNKRNVNSWHACNETVRIFRCLKLIGENLNATWLKRIEGMTKRVELKLKEKNA